MASEIAAKTEFLTVAHITLGNGNIIPISQLQSAYEGILSANNFDDKIITWKALKQLLQNEIANIEFHRPKWVNKPERVSVKVHMQPFQILQFYIIQTMRKAMPRFILGKN